MSLNIQNLIKVKEKLDRCNIDSFSNSEASYTWFTKCLNIEKFRHIKNLKINFLHPVTVIAGINRSGKTSALLLLACSHEKFMRHDASSSLIGIREHNWSDVLSFTTHETVLDDYQYAMEWRRAGDHFSGVGKRLHTSKAWSGLGKKSSDLTRVNAKVRNREVRLVDLERLLPGRAFSDSLFKKANVAVARKLDSSIVEAFGYIFGTPIVEISEVGSHVNKRCFLVTRSGTTYSTYNAASGEESVIYLLKDLIESPKGSLILVDEIEAGMHPSVQRKIIDILHLVAWRDKKQIVITTHSPTVLSAVTSKSRCFLESNNGIWRCIVGISSQAARSKMDSIGCPLVLLYCEDPLAQYLIRQVLVELTADDPHFDRLFNVVLSGSAEKVKNDYERHKNNFEFLTNKIGYCALFDGDCFTNSSFLSYQNNDDEHVGFIFPHERPEKFLVNAYLSASPHEGLAAELTFANHHTLFKKMIEFGLATDSDDARRRCYEAFKTTPDYVTHAQSIRDLLHKAFIYFSTLAD